MRRPIRAAAGLATATVMSLLASGCMTVHGELAVLPGAKKSEAAQALADFTEAYNKADKAYDPELDAGRVTGALGAINQAGLKARSITSPDGNDRHQPLELTDAKYLIPKKAGWPRWFVADTDSNRDKDDGPGDNRWVLVFVRGGADQLWEVAYLAILTPDEIPEFKTDKDGYAEPAPVDSESPAVAPGKLGTEYISYLKDGEPAHFAAGPHTDQWRNIREKNAKLPGLTIQYSDQPLESGDFAPLALTTKDGGALVFFAIKYFERQTAAPGYTPRVTADEKALMSGEVDNTLTKEWVSSQAALVKPGGADADQVNVVSRLQGVVGAEGS
ncbi:hypothetical protein ACIBLA_35935 [Streptomyces sp. NPDC050433]|uniref:hypothetical protein n=1 Tax=unclassified Streptomyces TaxID=2593676 RepID=UPI00341D91DD